MKYSCRKCHHVLTKDLYPSKKLTDVSTTFPAKPELGDFDEYTIEQYDVTEGSVYTRKPRYWFAPKAKTEIFINTKDANGCLLRPFITGNGCCANWGIPVECNNCYAEVGVENVDCHVTVRHVKLYPNMVYRDFSRRSNPPTHTTTHISFAEGFGRHNVSEDAIKRETDLIMKAYRLGQTTPFVDPVEAEMLANPDIG